MRPPAPIRVFVLVAAVVCLALAMCAHAPPARPPVHVAPQAQQAPLPRADPAAATARPAAPVERTSPEPDAGVSPTYFPATKAPPRLY